jgi:hypothetical protein
MRSGSGCSVSITSNDLHETDARIGNVPEGRLRMPLSKEPDHGIAQTSRPVSIHAP